MGSRQIGDPPSGRRRIMVGTTLVSLAVGAGAWATTARVEDTSNHPQASSAELASTKIHAACGLIDRAWDRSSRDAEEVNALVDQKQLAHPIRPVEEFTSQDLDDVHDAAQLTFNASYIDPRWESVHDAVLDLKLAVNPALSSDHSAAAQDIALRAALKACAGAAAP